MFSPTYFRLAEKLETMDSVGNQLYQLLENSCDKCKSDTIAMSGGLDSTIIAYLLKEKISKAITIISEDFVATDLTYCQLASKEFDISLQISKVSTAEILAGIQETIKILKNFNEIEIRNNVVMFLAMQFIKKQGKKSILTGDGADEIFAGYGFLKNKSEEELTEELKRIRNVMHFPTQKIGKYLGISVESPFLDENIIEFAKDIPINQFVNKHQGKTYGKYVLRKAFENRLPRQIVWREKSPMQDGAGTSGLTDLFDSLISNDKFEDNKKEIEKTDNVIIRNKESLHYYNIYRKLYDEPAKLHKSEFKCPYCKFQIKENSKFCRMCGAFPI